LLILVVRKLANVLSPAATYIERIHYPLAQGARLSSVCLMNIGGQLADSQIELLGMLIRDVIKRRVARLV
jgi:hypothetical protein